LCFRKVTHEIFSELDETKAEPPIIYRSFQKSEEKTPPPSALPRRGGGEKQNTKTEVVPAKIGGGNAAGVTPDHFSNLSDVTFINTAMKRE
jgi:hypothetical protein